jgi:hypothetical protein
MDTFEHITVPDTAIAAAETEIARVMRAHQLDRLAACALLVETTARLIAEDVIRGLPPYQPRIDRYVHIHRQHEQAWAGLLASL